MTTVAYEKTRILSITKAGIEYLDDSGGRCFVDFGICHRNFIAKMPSQAGSEPKYVGFRDYQANPPEVTLLTDPPTRFEFLVPKGPRSVSKSGFLQSHPEDFRDFEQFRAQLLAAGVDTGDMA